MKCPRCQAENDERLKFCEDCGASLARACPNCGAQVRPGKKFCGECGSPLDTARASRFASPEVYTPKHLAARILLSKDSLEGERKQVTVLFADLRGSTELIADRDPEEARKLLDPVLEKMMAAVHRYEGTVSRVMGDGIMALFGAPLALEDHALRACYAAVAMQADIRSYGEQLRRSQGVSAQIRVGLNSGEVVVRAISNDLHMDYTAMGVTTHLAARLEQLADPGTTILSSATLRLVEGQVTVKAQGPVNLKGLGQPIEVYELTGTGSARTRLQAAAARGLTRFVGRSGELSQMLSALERSHGGHGQVVALVGEPGVGKSRLAWELTHSHLTQGWLVLESASVSYGKASAYGPVIDLLKGYFQIEDRDDARRMREKVTGKLLTLDEALKPHLEPLLGLLEVAAEDERWKGLDPVQKRLRTLEACKRLILREAQVQPLLVVFEDLHWIDSESQALFDALVESLPTARVLLLVSFRPEYEHRWGPKSYYTQLRIDPLTGESAEELLRTLLGSDPALQPLARLLIERTEGNPLFLEESVRAFVETGVLQGGRGAYRLASPTTKIQVASTVQAIIAARIDRLAPEDKQLLQAAAVIGKDVPYSLLWAVAELSEEALRERLGSLQAAEFLYEKTLFPDLEYTFKHALTHEVTYGTLLQERRKTLHARIVGAIERSYPDRLTEHVDRLADHAVWGEMWEQAATYLHQAGVKALSRSANREAAIRFGQALTALGHLPENPGTVAQGIDVRLALRMAALALGDLRRVFALLCELDALAQVANDRRLQGNVNAYLTIYNLWVGDAEHAVQFGRRALSISDELADPAIAVLANSYLGAAYHDRGEFQAAMEFLGKSIAATQGASHELFGQVLPSVLPRVFMARCLAELGSMMDARDVAKEALDIAETAERPFYIAFGHLAVGHVHLRKGDLTRAVAVLQRAVELCRARGLSVWLPWTLSALGSAHALAGRFDVAIPLLDEAITSKAAVGYVGNHLFEGTLLGRAYLAAGNFAQAEMIAADDLRSCRDRRARGSEAWTLWLLGEIHSHHDRPQVDEAREYYHSSFDLASELGMRPLVGHCHLGLARTDALAGKPNCAKDHLITALTMYREMRMQYWPEHAEVALRTIV